MANHNTFLLSLLLLSGACAGQADDGDPDAPEPSATAPAARAVACDSPDVADCVEDDDLALCTRVAIKYEYEMLDARQRGDGPAYECHRQAMAAALEHACGLGDDGACEQGDRLASAPRPKA